MLNKGRRLKTEDFKELPKTKKRYTQNFTISTMSKLEAQNGQTGRFAVVAPKKLYKKAVLRNQAKRLVYNALQNIQTPFEKNFIFINKDILSLGVEEICNEIKAVLN